MASSRKKDFDDDLPRPPRAKTPEARENQMINLAMDQAELQLREGTASSPIVVHFLKLGTERAKLENEKLKSERVLLERRVQDYDDKANIEELFSNATRAMREYQGFSEEEFYED